MTAREYINVAAFCLLQGGNKRNTLTEMDSKYEMTMPFIPRIVCNDGFSISVQVNHGNYCASENGVRKFGFDWKLVEWGYPSERIDPEKYNCEGYDILGDNVDTTNSVGGFVEIELIDELCEEHGGINVQETLRQCARH